MSEVAFDKRQQFWLQLCYEAQFLATSHHTIRKCILITGIFGSLFMLVKLFFIVGWICMGGGIITTLIILHCIPSSNIYQRLQALSSAEAGEIVDAISRAYSTLNTNTARHCVDSGILEDLLDQLDARKRRR